MTEQEREIAHWTSTPIEEFIRSQEKTEPLVAALLPVHGDSIGIKRPRVLDLGSGDGTLALRVARTLPKAGKVVCVDVDQGRLDFIQSAADSEGVKIETMLGDGRQLPDVGRLNAAFSTIVFQHLPLSAVVSYITAVASHLKQGGVFRFQFIATGAVDRPSGFLAHFHPKDEIINACESAKLTVEVCETGVGHALWTWITARKRR